MAMGRVRNPPAPFADNVLPIIDGKPVSERKQSVAPGYDEYFAIPPDSGPNQPVVDIPQELLFPDPPVPSRSNQSGTALPSGSSDSRTLRSGTASTASNNSRCPVVDCSYAATDTKGLALHLRQAHEVFACSLLSSRVVISVDVPTALFISPAEA